jgi:hypothetical protein
MPDGHQRGPARDELRARAIADETDRLIEQALAARDAAEGIVSKRKPPPAQPSPRKPRQAKPADPPQQAPRADHQDTAEAVTMEHFLSYMPDHRYIHLPTGATWPAISVNARLPGVSAGPRGGEIPASVILDRDKPVEQMTWLPGAPMIIRHKYVREGGWIAHPGATVFNRYKPPIIEQGDPAGAQRWLDHLHYLYPETAIRIIQWCAHRVQFPGEEINHALVLGGKPGIGKDTILHPIKYGVGAWNFRSITAPQALEPNNDFLQSVILLISEARDGGKKVSPYQFYEETKVIIASPPDTLRINEKYIREYVIFNLCGVVITTNNRTNGLYLPADDRRHLVAWSIRTKEDERFQGRYFIEMYDYFESGGARDVTAYLMGYNLADFDPKAPPPQTDAFWAIANAGRSSEDAELADLLDRLSNPEVVTLTKLAAEADRIDCDLAEWLRDRANRRLIPHRLAACGYMPVRNPDADDGLWVIMKRRQSVYGKDSLSVRDQMEAVKEAIRTANQ